MNSSGYMSPEYALEGLFSIKSDVFSFGVLLLEILSGKKNTGFYHTGSLNLLGHVCHKIFHFYFCFFEQYDAMRTIHLFHLHKYFDKWIGKVNISYITRSRMHLWTFVLTFTCTVLQAWDLWKDNRALDLMDPILENEASYPMLTRYINVALLCVHENATDRPTMSEVVSMLTNEHLVLPSPKQPAFSYVRNLKNSNEPTIKPEACSVNVVTVSLIEAR